MSMDGKRAVVTTKNRASERLGGAVCVWDVPLAQLEHTLRGHVLNVWAVALSADGTRAVSCGGDNTLRVWAAERGELECKLEGHTRDVTSVSITPSGGHALTGSWDMTVRLWNLTTAECERVLKGHKRKVLAVALSASGEVAASGGHEGEVWIWEVRAGRCAHVLSGHTGWVHDVALDRSGRLVASAGQDGSLRVWDTARGGEPKRVIEPDGSGPLHACRFSTSEREPELLATGGADGIVRVYDTRTGVSLALFKGHTSQITSLAFSATHLMSGSHDATARVWRLPSLGDEGSDADALSEGEGEGECTDDGEMAAGSAATTRASAATAEHDAGPSCAPASAVPRSEEGDCEDWSVEDVTQADQQDDGDETLQTSTRIVRARGTSRSSIGSIMALKAAASGMSLTASVDEPLVATEAKESPGLAPQLSAIDDEAEAAAQARQRRTSDSADFRASQKSEELSVVDVGGSDDEGMPIS